MQSQLFTARSSRGFTQIEILVVVVVGLLAAIAIPTWQTFIEARRLNILVYRAMREAQNATRKIEQRSQLSKWMKSCNAVHPATISPALALE